MPIRCHTNSQPKLISITSFIIRAVETTQKQVTYCVGRSDWARNHIITRAVYVISSNLDGPILSSAGGYLRADVGLFLKGRAVLTAAPQPMPPNRRQPALRYLLKQCEVEGGPKSLLVAVHE